MPGHVSRAIALVALLATAARADDGEVKLSLPTEADRDAWTRPGFRLGLGVSVGELLGLGGAPHAHEYGAIVRAGLRLDAKWSLVGTFQFARLSSSALTGLHYLGTIDPTWHVTRAFSLAVGFGFGGLVGARTNKADIDPLPNTLDSSYNFPSANPPMPMCDGGGVAGRLRAEYAWVIGPRSNVNLSLELFGQYTECVETTGQSQPDTAQPIVRTQYWPMTGGSLNVGFMWR